MSEQYLFFWGHKPVATQKHVFSQWFCSDFVDLKGVKYICCEQYMMYQKAKLFGDDNIAKEILESTDPKIIKDLGKAVKNFDESVWNEHKFNIVVRGNTYKFNQNEDLKKILLKTKGKMLVEASPYDNIWGIGFTESNALANKEKWGENLLGKALVKVRDKL